MRRTIVVLTTMSLLCTSCALRKTRVPAVHGALVDVIIRASFPDGSPLPQTILLDTLSFGRLGFVVEQRGFSPAELRTSAAREVTPVDPDDVLECPEGMPCRVRNDATYVTLWDAVRTGDTLALFVTSTYNIERLHVMTESITHRVVLTAAADGWRLTARQRIPG